MKLNNIVRFDEKNQVLRVTNLFFWGMDAIGCVALLASVFGFTLPTFTALFISFFCVRCIRSFTFNEKVSGVVGLLRGENRKSNPNV